MTKPISTSSSSPSSSTTPRQPSAKGLAALKAREGGFVADAYPDAGGHAIGYGMQTWQGKPVAPGMVVTEADADAEFARQVRDTYAPIVNRALKVPVTQDQYDALISLAWNLPSAALHVIDKLNRGETLTEADFQRSATSQGKPNAGLSRRRREEWAPFAPTTTD